MLRWSRTKISQFINLGALPLSYIFNVGENEVSLKSLLNIDEAILVNNKLLMYFSMTICTN